MISLYSKTIQCFSHYFFKIKYNFISLSLLVLFILYFLLLFCLTAQQVGKDEGGGGGGGGGCCFYWWQTNSQIQDSRAWSGVSSGAWERHKSESAI
jgi:hypothetical protein